MWRNENKAYELHGSLNPRELWKVVQARNNQAFSHGGEQELSLDLAVQATPLSSRSAEMSVLVLSTPDPTVKAHRVQMGICGLHECFYLPDPLIVFAFYLHKTLKVC